MTTLVLSLRSSKGFTLVEILIVVLIVAVLSIATIPTVNSVSPFILDQSVSQVERALKFAREHARAMDTPTIVRFDSAARTVQVTRIVEEAPVLIEVPVMHPLIKTDYIVALDSQPLTATSIQLRAEFTFRDGSKAAHVAFDTNGVAGRLSIAKTFIPIQEPGTWRGYWRSAEGYAAGDWITHNNVLYDCLVSHSAGSSFAADLGARIWRVRTTPGQITVSAGPHRRDIHVEPSWGFIRLQPK